MNVRRFAEIRKNMNFTFLGCAAFFIKYFWTIMKFYFIFDLNIEKSFCNPLTYLQNRPLIWPCELRLSYQYTFSYFMRFRSEKYFQLLTRSIRQCCSWFAYVGISYVLYCTCLFSLLRFQLVVTTRMRMCHLAVYILRNFSH